MAHKINLDTRGGTIFNMVRLAELQGFNTKMRNQKECVFFFNRGQVRYSQNGKKVVNCII